MTLEEELEMLSPEQREGYFRLENEGAVLKRRGEKERHIADRLEWEREPLFHIYHRFMRVVWKYKNWRLAYKCGLRFPLWRRLLRWVKRI